MTSNLKKERRDKKDLKLSKRLNPDAVKECRWEDLIDAANIQRNILEQHVMHIRDYNLFFGSLIFNDAADSENIRNMILRYNEDTDTYINKIISIMTPHSYKRGLVLDSEIVSYFGIFVELEGVTDLIIHNLECHKLGIAAELCKLNDKIKNGELNV